MLLLRRTSLEKSVDIVALAELFGSGSQSGVTRSGRTGRIMVLALLLGGCDPGTSMNQAEPVPRQTSVVLEDGVRLATDLYLPDGPGRFPVVVERTPYDKSRWGKCAGEFVSAGYGFIVQDVRGRYESEGEWYPFVNEGRDGVEMLNWVHQQPWSDGFVAMIGPSYLASAQYLAVEAGGADLMSTLVPAFMTPDPGTAAYYRNGAFSLFLTFDWLAFRAYGQRDSVVPEESVDMPTVYHSLPVRSMDEVLASKPIEPWRDFVEHSPDSAYWSRFAALDHPAQYTVPILLVGGWYDYYAGEMLKAYVALAGAVDTADRTLIPGPRVLIGPWGHFHSLPVDPDSGVDYGESNRFDACTIYRDWISAVTDERTAEVPAVRLFVMGANEWRTFDSWPPDAAKPVSFALVPGTRSLEVRPAEAIADNKSSDSHERFEYDPSNPVPTLGGNHSIGPWSDAYASFIWAGPTDQRPIEARSDVLVYSSKVLTEDLSVIGPVIAKLQLLTTAPAADLVVRLTDVYPDGRSINVTEGIVRNTIDPACRVGIKVPIDLDACILEIELQPTAQVFRSGHRLRVHVTAGSFPLWGRNLQTGANSQLSSIYSSADFHVLGGSRITLSVLAGADGFESRRQ